MPTYAPASATVSYTPAILATLNDYLNETLIPQGYVKAAFTGFTFGNQPGNEGLGGLARPAVKLPSGLRRPERKTGEGTQAEAILNLETAGNMQAFYDLQTLNTAVNQGGTKIFTPWAHYSTYVAQSRTQRVENSGSGKLYDIYKSQLEQNTRDAFRKLETDLLGTNTDINHSTGQDELVGVQHWNAASPSTGTQHGLDRSVYIPFRNQTKTTTSFAATGLDDMDDFYYAMAGTNGNEAPDCIWTDDTQHSRYARQAMAVHRLVGSLQSPDLGVSGTLYFRGIPLIWTPDWAANRMDWLNTGSIRPMVLSGCDWESETPGKPNNVAIDGEKRWYFTGALLQLRPEASGVQTISGA
jgi:hypothetical protein